MCRAGGIPAGGARKLAHARLWLWETLTGGLPRQAPAALRLNDREFLSRHSRFTLHLPAATVRRLSEHARRLLDAHGRQHEPITWSPPTDGIALDQLPGPNPDNDRPDVPSRRDRATTNTRTDGSRARHHTRAPALPRTHAACRHAGSPASDRASESAVRRAARHGTATRAHRPRQLPAPDRGTLRHQPQDPPRRTPRARHPDPTPTPTPTGDQRRSLTSGCSAKLEQDMTPGLAISSPPVSPPGNR